MFAVLKGVHSRQSGEDFVGKNMFTKVNSAKDAHKICGYRARSLVEANTDHSGIFIIILLTFFFTYDVRGGW